jgi:hypothetical protein
VPLFPGLIQSVSGTTTGTSLTLTLPNNTSPGNTVIVTSCSSASPANPTISGITLGGSAGNFAQAASAGSPSVDAITSFLWSDPGCAGGQNSVVLTWTTGNTGSICATATEFAGLLVASSVDKTANSANGASGTSWSSTATSALSQPAEVAVGCCGAWNGTAIGTITGPSSPWTNLTQQTSASTHVGLLTGYQLLAATSAVTYAGSFGVTASYGALVVTFKAVGRIDLASSCQAVNRAACY